jgi:hypothetical protein
MSDPLNMANVEYCHLLIILRYNITVVCATELIFILQFIALHKQDFARTAEGIFRNSDRRTDLDKWYKIIMLAMFEAIPRIASEHTKTPSQVVKMGMLYWFILFIMGALK